MDLDQPQPSAETVPSGAEDKTKSEVQSAKSDKSLSNIDATATNANLPTLDRQDNAVEAEKDIDAAPSPNIADPSTSPLVTSEQQSVLSSVNPSTNGAQLTLAFQLEDSIVWAVDVQSWHEITPPLSVNDKNFRQFPYNQWSPNVKTFHLRSTADAKVMYVVHQSPGSQPMCRAIAIQVRGPKIDVSRDLNAALQSAMDAYVEFEADVGRAIRNGVMNLSGIDAQAQSAAAASKPTFGQLLSALLSPNVLTSEQRDQINHVAFSFLQHELSLARAYQHISQIVGLSTIRQVIRSITAKNAKEGATAGGRPIHVPIAQENGSELTVVDADRSMSVSNGLSASRYRDTGGAGVLASGFPTPAYFFKGANDQKAFFAFNDTQNYLQMASQQHTCPFWVELPDHDPLPMRIGQHVLENANVWLMIGGLMKDHTFSFLNSASNTSSGWLEGCEFLTVVNQLDFKSTTQPLLGDIPSGPRLGSACHLIGEFPPLGIDSDCIILFGGDSSDIRSHFIPGKASPDLQTNFDPTNDLYVLNLQNLKWMKFAQHEDTAAWPSPRCYCVSGVVLKEIFEDSSKDECEVSGFFIAGGLGLEKQVLDDIWYFDFTRGSWTLLSQKLTTPLWGAACTYAGINSFIVQGGWTSATSSSATNTDPDGFALVPDLYLLSLSFTGADEKQTLNIACSAMSLIPHPSITDPEASQKEEARMLGRALHSAFLIYVGQRVIRPYDLGTRLSPTDADSKTTLLLCGGYCPATTKLDLVLVDIHVSSEGEPLKGCFTTSIEPQLRPFSPQQTIPCPRWLWSISFFSCISPLPSARPKPGCPSLFLHGGLPMSDSPMSEASWIIALHSVDPFELSWYHPCTGRGEQHKRPLGAGVAEEALNVSDSRLGTVEDEGVLRYLRRSKQATGSKDTLEICRLFTEHLRHNAAWMCGINFTPGVFQSLGSLVKWPFSPFGNLLENSTALSTRSTHVSIEVGITAGTGVPYIAVQDNGRGLPFTSLNRALKRFGNWDGPNEKRDVTKSHQTIQYGMGLKFAFSRISQSVLVISRTRGTIGVALFSQTLLFHADSQTVACPSCFWRLPSKDTVFPEAEHWKHQQKIQQFSPFRTAAALAEQINALGARPGTRIVFFDFKPVYPLSLGLDPCDVKIRLSSAPSSSIYTTNEVCPPSSAYHQPDNGLLSLQEKFDVQNLDNSKELETLTVTSGGKDVTLHLSANGYRSTSSYMIIPRGAPVDLTQDPVAFTQFEKESLFDNLAHYVEAKSTQTSTDEAANLPSDLFPCWASARDSIDYCLPTYLYWSMLFCPSTLWHSACPLIPIRHRTDHSENVDVNGKEHFDMPQDPFKRSLWRYLKANLHGMVELDYLFHPEDAHAEAFGLLGFLNPLDRLVESPNVSLDTSASRVYEAGVLLYYKERLIRRMFVPFPAPAELLDRFGRGRYPQSHFTGHPIFMFPCTAVIQVPDWLYPNASREDFVAERSPVFDDFTYKLKKLIAQYLSVCLDEEARNKWALSRGEALLQESGRTRPLSPMLHMALLKSLHTSTTVSE